jgi:hypothetical protein
MSNVLSEEKKQQVIALGRLGWPLRRIEQVTGVRRETANAYLKAAGIAVRPPGEWRRRAPAKPANEVTTDFGGQLPESGKYRRTRLFVMTLGYSRKSGRLLVFRSRSRIWAELHEKAFHRSGGSVRVVVLDNLREGVIAPDIYDPTLNPLYQDLLAYYGAVAMPCCPSISCLP